MEPSTQSNSASNPKLGNIVLGILLLAALVLGYFLYQKMKGPAMPSNSSEASSELSSDERAVLTYPSPDVTEGQWNEYLRLVAKLAVDTDTITLGDNCSVSPVVLRTPLVTGKKLMVKNEDNVAHVISFNNPPTYTVPANGTAEVPGDFGGAAGIYGYGCDESPQAVGLIQVLR